MIQKNTISKSNNEKYQYSILNSSLFKNSATIIGILTILISSYGWTWKVSASVDKMQNDSIKNTADTASIQQEIIKQNEKITNIEKDHIRLTESLKSIGESVIRIESSVKDTNNMVKETNQKVEEAQRVSNKIQIDQATLSSSIRNIENNTKK